MDNRNAKLIAKMREAGLYAEADALEGVVRRAQLDWKKGLIPGPSKNDLVGPSAFNKMKPEHVPEWAERYMDTSLQKPKEKIRLPKPGYYVHPDFGGEGKELPSGAHAVSFNPPPRKQGDPYSKEMGDYTLDVLTEDEYVPEWDEIGDLESFTKDYLAKAEADKANLGKTSTGWEKRMRDWPERAKQNFWVNLDWMIGDPNGLITPESSSLLASIENRLMEIRRIENDPSAEAGLPPPREAASDGREVTAQAAYADPLRGMRDQAVEFLSDPESFDNEPKYYLQVLSLLYGGKIEKIIENPLGVGPNGQYPRELVEFLKRYQEANPPSAPREVGTPATVDEMIDRPWTPPGIKPEDIDNATWSKKHSVDAPMYGGFTTGNDYDLPMPDARDFHKTDYEEEKKQLEQIKQKAIRVEEIAHKAPDRSAAGVAAIAPEMDEALRDLLGEVVDMYGSSNFVTKGGRMNLTYGIGAGSKMEIFLKAMLLGQGWKAYQAAAGQETGPGPVDPSKMIGESPDLSLPEDRVLSTEASEHVQWLRLASVFEAQGRFDWADQCEAMAKFAFDDGGEEPYLVVCPSCGSDDVEDNGKGNITCNECGEFFNVDDVYEKGKYGSAERWFRVASICEAQGHFELADQCEAMAREAQFDDLGLNKAQQSYDTMEPPEAPAGLQHSLEDKGDDAVWEWLGDHWDDEKEQAFQDLVAAVGEDEAKSKMAQMFRRDAERSWAEEDGRDPRDNSFDEDLGEASPLGI